MFQLLTLNIIYLFIYFQIQSIAKNVSIGLKIIFLLL